MSTRAPLAVAAAQPVCQPLDLAHNAAAHAAIVRAAGARVVVFPELSLTGYELGAPAVSLEDAALDPLREACANAGATALVGAPVRVGDADYIATVQVTASVVEVVYRKNWPGAEEAVRFAAGPATAVLDVSGWRLGLAICRDTGVDAHTAAVGSLAVDGYVAGVVHHPDELEVQDARGARIARQLRVPVVFASAAGNAGADYRRTAGTSTIWSATGDILGRCGPEPGEWTTVSLS